MQHSQNELTQKLNTLSGQVSDQTHCTTAATLSTVALLSAAAWLLYDSSMNNDQRIEQINDALNKNKPAISKQTISSQEIEENKRLARAKNAYDLILSKSSNTTIIIPKYNEKIQSIFNQAIIEQDNNNNEKSLPDTNNAQANGKRTFALMFSIIGIGTGYVGHKDNKKRKDFKAQKTSVEAQIQTLDN